LRQARDGRGLRHLKRDPSLPSEQTNLWSFMMEATSLKIFIPIIRITAL